MLCVQELSYFQASLFSSYFGKFDALMSSLADISIDIGLEFNSFDHSRSMTYIATDRPWLSKYNMKLTLQLKLLSAPSLIFVG